MTNYERLCELLCGGPTAYTPSGVAQFKQAGRYGKTPSEGAFIYFYSSNLHRVSHVGIVVSAEFRNGLYYIRTREGNTAAGKNDTAWRDGGKSMEHTYEFLLSQVGGANRINGFGYPRYGADTCSAQQLIEESHNWLGYLEHETPEHLEEFEANVGDNNCTLFGRWYGQAVGDTATYTCAQWCSMFCCYVAYQAIVKAQEQQPSWYEEDGHWFLRRPDGGIYRDEWAFYGGRWYVFDGEGRMITDWFCSKEGWYYLAGDGAMCSSQWIVDDGKSYYLTASGAMATSAYVKSDKPYGPGGYIYYWVNASGVWEPQWDTDDPHLDVYELAK